VYNRVTLFLSTLFRDWERKDNTIINSVNVIIVTHGQTLRLFLMRWFQFSVKEFEETRNPQTGAVVVMHREDLLHTKDSTIISRDVLRPSTCYKLDESTLLALNIHTLIVRREEYIKERLKEGCSSGVCYELNEDIAMSFNSTRIDLEMMLLGCTVLSEDEKAVDVFELQTIAPESTIQNVKINDEMEDSKES